MSEQTTMTRCGIREQDHKMWVAPIGVSSVERIARAAIAKAKGKAE